MTASAPLPLAFSPAPCMHRQVGVDALDGAGLDWRVAFTSPSQQGLRAAVLAGLAITALPQGDLEPGMVVIDGQHGLPALPAAQFQLLWRAAEHHGGGRSVRAIAARVVSRRGGMTAHAITVRRTHYRE